LPSSASCHSTSDDRQLMTQQPSGGLMPVRPQQSEDG